MMCRDVLDRVEVFAAGERQPDEPARAHLETCPRCASALADARRIEAFLASWPAPQAPARFTAAVQHRIRRLHWQAEQRVDRLFNGAILVAAVLVLAGLAAMFNMELVVDTARVLTSFVAVAGAEVVQQAAPSLATYLAAMGLLASALVTWWWAEGNLGR